MRMSSAYKDGGESVVAGVALVARMTRPPCCAHNGQGGAIGAYESS
jgi:hypothetical protein